MSALVFGKEEKLKSKKEIDTLFQQGESFVTYPMKVLFKGLGTSDTNQVLVSVPKRRFRKAVVRNRIKRLIRESYRQNKSELIANCSVTGKYFAIAFVYIGKDVPHYATVNDTMQKVLVKLKSLD